jgi:putative transposase
MPIIKQCQLLGLSRSGVYYRPVPVSQEDLAIMRRLDELHLCYPFFGARKLTVMLNREGVAVGRKRVRRLMRVMGIFAIYRRPRTTVPTAGHRVFPYLLRGVEIVRPNQVWEADITYLPMRRGFLYLVAIVDVFSRRAMAWRLSNTLSVDFCVAALEEALGRYGAPEIFNTDQGSQFTSQAFTEVLEQAKVRISMDGRGRWVDNVFIERLWRSVKYEEVYLHAWETGAEAKAALARYFAFYNGTRPHEALSYRTPDELYFNVWCEIAGCHHATRSAKASRGRPSC